MAQPASSNHPTLAKERADRFRSMGALGKPAWQNHVQLRAMLRAKRGETFANYLAKPSYDPDQGELRWTAEVPGAARRFEELGEEDQARASLTLLEVRAGLTSFIEELRAQGGGTSGGTGAFALLLEQAMKVPAEEYLYFVGQQPVIAFWGFQDQDGRSVDPTFRAPTYTAGSDLPAGQALPTAATPVAPGTPESTAPRKRPWWWWLLWALLALLLLLALLFLLRGCHDEAGIVGSLPPGSTKAPGGASAPPGADPSAGPGGITGPSGLSGPGGITGPGGTVDGGVVSGPGGTSSGPGADGLPAAPTDSLPGTGLPDAGKDPTLDPTQKADPAKDPSKDPPKDPTKDPKQDPKKDPKADPKNNPKAKTDPPMPPVDPKALKIPPDATQAKKMDFLEGDWKAGENLADSKTQQPLDLGIKFGKDGKGEITLKRSDGSSCKGPVQGKMESGRLSVEGNQSIPCSNGSNYAPPKIVCQPDSGGQTPCYGVNPDGSKYYMGMRRN